jgi:hypothetical protein
VTCGWWTRPGCSTRTPPGRSSLSPTSLGSRVALVGDRHQLPAVGRGGVLDLAAGQSIEVLQALLGHKSAVETWDTYGHLMGDEDDRSRSAIEDAFGNSDHSKPQLSARPQVRARVRMSWLIGRVLFAVRPRERAVGDHPSGMTVAGHLVQSTRGSWGGPPDPRRPRRVLLDLAPGGVCLATTVARRAGGLLHHRFTLTNAPRKRRAWRSVFCGTFPRVAPGGCCPPPCPVEPGPSSTQV